MKKFVYTLMSQVLALTMILAASQAQGDSRGDVVNVRGYAARRGSHAIPGHEKALDRSERTNGTVRAM